jgi:colicin import membrane protein
MVDTYLDPDDAALLEAVLQRPALLARPVALAPKPAPSAKRAIKAQALGDTPKQRAAWLRLSSDRQAYLVQWESWRKAWKAARYAGGAEPGPEPIDTTSQEALAQVTRNAEHEARVAEFERIMNERWGGSLYARDEALRDSANILRSRYKTDAEHAAAVQAFMDAASVEALAQAAKRAADAEAKAKADAEAKAKADAWDAANPEAAAALAARLAAR